jgi:hypothetical protein
MTRPEDETPMSPEALAELAQALVEPVRAPPSVRASLLARLKGESRYAPFGCSLKDVFDLSDAGLVDLLARASQSERWTAGIPPVRRYLDFRPGPAALAPRAGLVTLAAGCRIPAHRHDEPEVMLVLEGQVSDDLGRVAGPGERIASQVGAAHAVTVGPRDATVALLHGRIHLLGT